MSNTLHLRGSLVEAALEDMRGADGSLIDWLAYLASISATWDAPNEIAIHGDVDAAERTACYLALKYAGLATYSMNPEPDFITFRHRRAAQRTATIKRRKDAWLSRLQ